MFYSRSKGRRGSDASDTHGTYIYDIHPEDLRLYYTQDPTRCECRCCPHPRRRCSNTNPAAASDTSHHSDPASYNGRRHTKRAYRPSSRHYAEDSDYHRSSHRFGKNHAYTMDDGRESDHSSSAQSHSYEARRRRRHPVDLHHVIVDVVDRTSSQALSARYGRRFPLSIFPDTTTARDVSLFLAPNSRCERVVVRWRDGEVEPLDDLVPLIDLEALGARLEVRTRKRVHWSE
ncbi:hypothetical protein LIA77_00585 [Sarocladium implicatum]|nr:hypothetical protein LIA77_00585 [Sarocladium implicatum]